MQLSIEYPLLVVAYLVAAILFILSLRGLSSQETARKGNLYGIIGMALAVGAVLTSSVVSNYAIGAAAIGGGAVIGAYLAARVAMTAMPELVALLHSFVGLAAVLVGVSYHLGANHGTIEEVEIFVDVAIGALTFTGSVLAFFKLRGTISGRPLLLPGRHLLNLGLLVAIVVLGVFFVGGDVGAEGHTQTIYLLVMSALAGVLGVHLVAGIGGADMPVVVSMLNSYSGWTAAAAGFMLQNDLLIVTGALVGSSGAILSYIMCRAMNRSIVNVIFGGFGAAPTKKSKAAEEGESGEVAEIDTAGLAEALRAAKEVIVVPGYGLAVARAQHSVREMAELLKDRGINVRFGIHPVAGRLPGHMNVLLAEANVPYPIVLEMDEINEDFAETDVVMVVGANDIVNPGAKTDESSPIYGMPVLEVWNAKMTVIMKRSRATGYAGVDNPLFYHERSRMLFGDALDTMQKVVAELKLGGH